jgi:lipopolysaccharide/colanic/teichoic acid biosynthesis glycosyltransferase
VYINLIKPLLDRLFTFILSILLSPVIVITTLVVAIGMGAPILFAQKRPGLHGKIFTIYKFRTMSDERDEKGELMSDEVRLGKIGKIMRSLSLDELPQLWNVLRGEMSFIGPRPLLPEYLPLYSPKQARRHAVKPGITGWAQVNGRNSISWEEKFVYDGEYVDKISFGMDMKIVLLTIKKILLKEGITQEGEVSMEKFRG